MTKLTVNNQTPVQTAFQGHGAVYHGYAGMPDDDGRVYSEAQCELEANRAADLGIKLARTFYGYWAWEPEVRRWNWETPQMQAFYRWLARMKKRGIQVALNTGWWLQFELDRPNSPFYAENNLQQSIQSFANWVSESYVQLVEKRGFTNITTFVLFTEPNCGYNNQKMWQLWGQVALCVHQTLQKNNQRSKILLMGPNEGSGRLADMSRWLSGNAELKEVVDIYASHCYLEDYVISKRHLQSGRLSVALILQGGRFCQTVQLKPNTAYTATAYAALLREGENATGADSFGVFEFAGKNDIHAVQGHGPAAPLSAGSVVRVEKSALSQQLSPITVCFKTGDCTQGVIGWFHDFTGGAGVVVDRVLLTESEGGGELLQNPTFENGLEGWFHTFCGGTVSPYYDWYKWAKTGLQYTPAGRQFCFDEYNIAYEKDFSRPEHGAQLATAMVAMMNAGVNATLLWTLFDQQWPNNHTNRPADCFYNGEHRWGLMPGLNRSLKPHFSYYAFGLVSKCTFANSTVYAGGEANRLCATMNVGPNGEVTVIVVNAKEEPDEFCLQFKAPLGKTLHRHSFDPLKITPTEHPVLPAADLTLPTVQQQLQDSIAPNGILVYTTCDL